MLARSLLRLSGGPPSREKETALAPQYRNRFLENQRSIPVNPEIATALGGADEALVLQQLNYWLANPKVGQFRDDRHWVYNTYEKWQENFPWLSISTIRRIIGRLEKEGIIRSTDKYNEAKTNRTKWYTIDEERLGDFLDRTPSVDSVGRPAQNEQVDYPERTARPAQNEQVDCSDRAGLEVVNLSSSGHRLPETTSKTTHTGAGAPDHQDFDLGVPEDDPILQVFRDFHGVPTHKFRERTDHARRTVRGNRKLLQDAVKQLTYRKTHMADEARFAASLDNALHTLRLAAIR
jgi:hypothetical protein